MHSKFLLPPILISSSVSLAVPRSEKATIIRCETVDQRSDTFGFSALELTCQSWPSAYKAQFREFADCQVNYTRRSGIHVASKAQAFGREGVVAGIRTGQITIIPQTLIPYADTQKEHFDGFKLTWNVNTWPSAMTMESCTPAAKSGLKNKSFYTSGAPLKKRTVVCAIEN